MEIKNKKIYVCSPLRGNIENNIEMAKLYCTYIVREYGYIPLAPHIYFTQFLDDNIDSEREFGIRAGLSLLPICDELWYFGRNITKGMTEEIDLALKLGIPTVFVPEYKYTKHKYERNSPYEIKN